MQKPEIKQQIQQAIEEWLRNKNDSQNQLAKQIGISAAHLTNVRKGYWEKLSEKQIISLKNFFQLDGWHVRNTPNLASITKLADDAQSNARMLAVAGFTGAGKTTALKHYATKQPNTYYVLSTFFMGRKDFLKAIQRSMGLDVEGSVSTMCYAITEHLKRLDSPLLIIDDAGKLTDANYRMLQVIYDETEFHAGIVLAGTEYLKQYLDQAASKNKMGFRELRRRIAYWQPLEAPTLKIVAAICQDYGITNEDTVRYITREANDYGTLRNIITNALKASDNPAEITPELISDLSIGTKHYEDHVTA